jgi:hypothetical protein
MAHQILQPAGCETEGGHVGVGALAVRVSGKLCLQHIVDPLLDFFQLCFAWRA